MTNVVRLRLRETHPAVSVCESILSVVQRLALLADQIQGLAHEPDRKSEALRFVADAATALDRASTAVIEGASGNAGNRWLRCDLKLWTVA